MKNKSSLLSFTATAVAFAAVVLTKSHAATIGFEDLTLAPESYNNGGPTTNSSGFTSGGALFSNDYNATYDSWSGFSYSNKSDSTTAGYGNQYSAITGSGVGGSGIYGVAYPTSRITLADGQNAPLSIQVTNTTYAYFSMKDGDSFAKKFGGTTGNDPDRFTLTISGFDAGNNLLGSVNFDLANYTFADNSLDYIVNTWQTIDLTSLGTSVKTLDFSFTSTDSSVYGPNTPTYVALDNLTVVPEPSGLALCGLPLALLAGYRRFRR